MHRTTRVVAVAVFLAALWALFQFSGLKSHFSLQAIHDGFEQNMVAGLLVFAALFALGNLAQIPGWLFLVAAVLALGRVWGGLATYLAACLSCVTSLAVIRALGGDALRRLPGRWMARVLARLDAHPTRSVLALRLVFQTAPAVNVALALSGVPWRPYLLGTLLGLPLPILLYTVFFDTVARWLHWPLPA